MSVTTLMCQMNGTDKKFQLRCKTNGLVERCTGIAEIMGSNPVRA